METCVPFQLLNILLCGIHNTTMHENTRFYHGFSLCATYLMHTTYNFPNNFRNKKTIYNATHRKFNISIQFSPVALAQPSSSLSLLRSLYSSNKWNCKREQFWMLIIFFDTVFNVMLVKCKSKSACIFFLFFPKTKYFNVPIRICNIFILNFRCMSYATVGAINSTSVRITRAK